MPYQNPLFISTKQSVHYRRRKGQPFKQISAEAVRRVKLKKTLVFNPFYLALTALLTAGSLGHYLGYFESPMPTAMFSALGVTFLLTILRCKNTWKVIVYTHKRKIVATRTTDKAKADKVYIEVHRDLMNDLPPHCYDDMEESFGFLIPFSNCDLSDLDLTETATTGGVPNNIYNAWSNAKGMAIRQIHDEYDAKFKILQKKFAIAEHRALFELELRRKEELR